MPTRESRARAHRRVIRRRRQVVGTGLMLSAGLLVFAGLGLTAALTDHRARTGTGSAPTRATTFGLPVGSASPTSTSPKSTAAKSSSATVTAEPATRVRSTGEYASAPGGTDGQGPGTLRTYRVEVETGIGQSARVFATAVDATLADPGSWTGQGKWSLQRVSTSDPDFVIRLATPATVDKVCATAGLDTRGYVSCRAGRFVMINLDRWLNAVPDYRGDVVLYRQYVINHEVGHQLDYSHQACPGPDSLAPVMQQQTFGLDGCRPNGSPYVDGELVTGPAAP